MENKKFLTQELVTRAGKYSFFKHLGILPSADKLLSRQGKTYDTLRDLKNDPHVWACIQSRKSGLLSLSWSLEGTSPRKSEIERILDELDIYSLFCDILEAPLFGFQPLEIVWDYNSKSQLGFVPKKIEAKPQEWFFFDGENKLRIRGESVDASAVAPPEKILCVFHDASYQNPYGTSLLSKCYWSCTFKNGALRFWINFMEKFGMPVVLGKYNRGASESEIKDLLDALSSMSENSVIVSPMDIDISLEDPARSSSVELYHELIKLMNAEISKAILSQTLTTELDTGSYAASQTHLSIRKEVIKSDINLVERCLNNLIRLIYQVNGFDKDDIKFKMGK